MLLISLCVLPVSLNVSCPRNTNQSQTKTSGSGSESVSQSFGQPNGLMRQIQDLSDKRRTVIAPTLRTFAVLSDVLEDHYTAHVTRTK